MPAESSAAPAPDLTADATFADLGVPAPLVEVLDDQGITEPFPVQAAALPDALAGRDILGRAQTGSGKTLGFSLPLVSRLAGGSTLRRSAARPGPRAHQGARDPGDDRAQAPGPGHGPLGHHHLRWRLPTGRR